MREKLIALRGVWGVLSLFVLVIGGIYAGIFTPTEAAGIGAAGAFLIALFRRSLTLRSFYETLADTGQTTTSLFVVIIGALIFSNFVNRADFPDQLLAFVTQFEISPLGVIFIILLVYLLLGFVFESLSMLLLTVPIFYPLVESLGFDLIWFGIVVVVATEISLITPPIGLNVFVLSSVLKDVSTLTIFKGVTPFWIADIVRILLIVLFPAIALFLPEFLYH